MWFDSHCHLYENGEGAYAATASAKAAGVVGILTVGVDPVSSARCAEVAAREPEVWAGAAYHPSEVKGWQPGWIDEIDAFMSHPEVVAVGETGLDFHWDRSYLEDQERAFAAHVDLAKRSDKALVVHTRSSVDEALGLLGELGPPDRLIFHCWSGNRRQLSAALAVGAYVSFAGNVSFKKSQELRALCRLVPDDRLLIETDSPYLTPEPFRGKRNQPANVVHVGDAVARAREWPAEQVARVTTDNARRVLGLAARSAP